MAATTVGITNISNSLHHLQERDSDVHVQIAEVMTGYRLAHCGRRQGSRKKERRGYRKRQGAPTLPREKVSSEEEASAGPNCVSRNLVEGKQDGKACLAEPVTQGKGANVYDIQ